MKTQDTGKVDTHATPPLPAHPKHHAWLVGITAIVMVVILVGLSVLVFAQLRQRQAGQVTPTPSTGQWKQVLQGYALTSILAARSKPSVLYACASQMPTASSQGSESTFTLLRSTDFGDHWQNTGSKAALGSFCQLAINPSDSNDIYAVTVPGNAQPRELLMHSTDGGQTWETIQPVLHVPGTNTPAPWLVQQIQVEGNHLFGIQLMTGSAIPGVRSIPSVPYLLTRLVTSIDGGRFWTVIDNQFATQRLGVHSYAIDPTNPHTVYDLVGGSWYPPVEVVPPQGNPPNVGLNQELFKTTDDGATWQLLLNDIPFGSQVQLASGNPQVIYVGGTIGPLPLVPRETKSTYPIALGSFHLQLSTNGGANWSRLAIPSDMLSIQNWYVSPAGQVYASPTISGQPTAVAGTVVPITPRPVPTGDPQATGPSVQHGASAPTPGTRLAEDAGISTTPTLPIVSSQFIRRYDPTSNRWSDVTRPPTYGFVVQVTPAQANAGAILWFMGTTGGKMVLYRFVV